jgi:hypothetical protein
MTDGGLQAALSQLAQVRADLTKTENRVTSNWVKITVRLRDLAAQLAEIGEAGAAQGELLDRLDQAVAALSDQVASLIGVGEGDGPGYRPAAAPRWWLLDDDQRQAAASRLASWVATVYVPGYGILAAQLPACWAAHPLCLYTLDWLSELHSLAYLQPRRTAGLLAAQAEWQTRLLPAAVDQMAAECRSCAHARAIRNGARR